MVNFNTLYLRIKSFNLHSDNHRSENAHSENTHGATPNTNSILKVYQLVLKSKPRKILVLEKLSSQEIVLKVPKKKPSISDYFDIVI